jgi:hypothetical protein
MKRPRGVGAAETMTTGSEVAAMATVILRTGAMDYSCHIMQRKKLQWTVPMRKCRARMSGA